LLAHIRPTLKKANETSTEKNETPTKKTSSTSIKDSSTPKKEKAPTPAKKEDCVFEVTAANFQKLVLESPVPVLLDIYADWCGPCKQLGPMLESAAMKSGGMFRLAKINSDKEPSLSQTLGVTGLPTVFSCVNGKLSDRFVGMLPQEQLQQYIVRAVTGYGERVQKDISDAALKEFTQKISIMAGLASFSFKKKTKLNLWVDEALALEGGMDDRGTISPSVRAALQYIDNASKDVRNEKLRTIKGTSKVFIEKIIISPSALRILDIAGFKTNDSMTAIENNGDLSLVHSNMAILNLVSQVTVTIVIKYHNFHDYILLLYHCYDSFSYYHFFILISLYLLTL
jgi:thioredoxin